jgi:hypothetical protein
MGSSSLRSVTAPARQARRLRASRAVLRGLASSLLALVLVPAWASAQSSVTGQRAGGHRFQARQGLTIDGVAGPLTLAALTASVAPIYPGAGFDEAAGSPSVRELQRWLQRLGFAPGPLDGRDGPLTTRAVERFQQARGLEVDGIVGVRTWHALRRTADTGVRRVGLEAPLGVKSAPVPISPSPAPSSPPVANDSTLPTSAHDQQHVPTLPATLVLVGLAALGLGTVLLSYWRAHAQVRRARASAPARALGVRRLGPPPSWPAPARPLVPRRKEQNR